MFGVILEKVVPLFLKILSCTATNDEANDEITSCGIVDIVNIETCGLITP